MASDSARCPETSVLAMSIRGELAFDEADAVAAHLETCADCGARCEALIADVAPNLMPSPSTNTAAEKDDVAAERLEQQLASRSGEITAAIGRLRATQDTGGSGQLDTALALEQFPYLTRGPSTDFAGELGHYRIRRLLGRGGMGLVFAAHDPKLRRDVALKVMRPELARHRSPRDRFLTEARAIASLRHEHIVSIFDIDEIAGFPFFAMELLHGESLAARLDRDGCLPIETTLEIGRQIASGLAVAHRHGVVHRDIKPDNIFLVNHAAADADAFETADSPDAAEKIHVKLLDFGLARNVETGVVDLERPTASPRAANPSGRHETEHGTVLGTPAFMSPEQARGIPADARSDLFSLGLVLYHMVTGRLPDRSVGRGDETPETTGAEPLKVESLQLDFPSDAPEGFIELVRQLLRENPAERPEHAADVTKRLETKREAEPFDREATASSETRRAVSAAPESAEPSALAAYSATAAPATSRQTNVGTFRKTLFAAAGAVAVLCGIVITILSPDGTRTTVEVPESTPLTIEPDGRIHVNGKPLQTSAAKPAMQPPEKATVTISPVPKLGPDAPRWIVESQDVTGSLLGDRTGQPYELLGSALATVGDLDGDGVEELAIGAAQSEFDGLMTGSVRIVFLNADGAVRKVRQIGGTEIPSTEDHCFERFGSAIASLGDIDGDGTVEVLVGAVGNVDKTEGGAVYVLSLDSDATVTRLHRISRMDLTDQAAPLGDDRFGCSLAVLGDWTGDGVPEVAIGSSGSDTGASDAGAVYLVELNEDGTLRKNSKIASGSSGLELSEGNRFGSSIIVLNEPSPDGLMRVLVGAPGDHNLSDQPGELHDLTVGLDGRIESSRRLNRSTVPGLSLNDGDQFGASLLQLDDATDDGIADVLVGAAGSAQRRGGLWLLPLSESGRCSGAIAVTDRTGAMLGKRPEDATDNGFGTSLSVRPVGHDSQRPGILVGIPRIDTNGNDSGVVYQLNP